jgi:hypothetical protein
MDGTNYKFMAKVFLSSIGLYNLGPMGSPPKNSNVKVWNARKSMGSISLKNSCYYKYVARFKASGSLSYSTSSDPFDITCEGDQYCKGNITSTNSIQWKVATATDIKISKCNEDPKCNTKEVTIMELMFYLQNSWNAKIESKYRVKNAQGSCPTGPEISNCNTKMKNCCQDSKMVYIEAEERWVRVELSGNPDTTFADYTYKVDSSISVTPSDNYLDDSDYTVQSIAYFDGSYLYLNYASDYDPKTCQKFTGKGTLTYIGKIVTSYLNGQPCDGPQGKGTAFLSTSWSPISKLGLMPS